ncbi:MAG TPA: ornithine carbamoyltransferase [Burkholderiaceae bacterium]|nr:ornithine carbamoyltransferase [Burkholderiaceae bacterium]
MDCSVVMFERLSGHAERRLVAVARALADAERSGSRDQPLRGKNLALWAPAPGPAAALFIAAVEQLGATTSQIGDEMLAVRDEHELQRVARMLDRLYDAVECQGVPAGTVRRLSDLATVPVFDGIACESHRTTALAEQLADCGSATDARRWVLQAAVLQTMA